MMNKDFLFPVKVPYSTAPDIVKLKDSFQLSSITDAIFKFKMEQLALYNNHLFGEVESEQLNNALQCIRRLYQLPELNSISDLAMSCIEDVAVLSLGKVIAIHFCSPSGFIPNHLLGKSFFEIHQPVPDAELLLKMSDKLSAVLSDVARGPHRRYVWTLTANPSRNQHPSLRSNYNPKTIHDLFFRTEVQTTVPLGDNVHALFAVDVKMTALADLWDDTSKKNAILESIQSMSNNMLHYKNLNDIKLIIEKAK